MAAAVCNHSPGLVWQELGWVDHLRLQTDLLIDMLAKLYLQGFPNLLTHT
jgi:hypothetical protein